MIRVIIGLCSILMLAGCQEAPTYTQSDSSVEGGSGRVYLDREIADVMSSEHGALWLDRPERDLEELPNRLFRVLNLNPSTVVADIGSGTGFFTFRLASLVPHGRVYAVEVQQALVDTIQVRSSRNGFSNVTPILGTVESPNLPSNRVDLALIVSSYHEFSYPKEMIESIFASLKSGARLVIVVYRLEDETVGIPEAHRMSEAQIRVEIEAAGFEFRGREDVLPQQHVLIFRRP